MQHLMSIFSVLPLDDNAYKDFMLHVYYIFCNVPRESSAYYKKYTTRNFEIQITNV